MKKIRLVLATVIGFIGLFIYFMTMTSIDEDTLVDIRVQAGDKDIFEDVYLSGYLYDFDNFQIADNEVMTLHNLSYLERLDAHYFIDMYLMQQEYPEFMDILMYEQMNHDYLLLESSDYLMSGSFQYSDDYEFQIDGSELTLTMLDKETEEITEEVLERPDGAIGDQMSVIGLYEAYPNIHILYNISNWEDSHMGYETSTLSYGVYNIETKNYSEKTIINEEGSFYDGQSISSILPNKQLMLFEYYGGDTLADTKYLFNFADGSFKELDDSLGNIYINNQDDIFELVSSDGATVLRQYNDTFDEIVNEVTLATDKPINILTDISPVGFYVIDEKVYIFENQYAEESNKPVEPTLFQVFDLNTGENLSSGEIHYDTNFEVNAREGSINYIGKNRP